MRVLICGSRHWDDEAPIRVVLAGLDEVGHGREITVIHGAAKGADGIAGKVAEQLRYTVASYPADWTKHGKPAGHIRNAQMLREGKPNVVFAFKDNFDWTFSEGGTENMVKIAKDAGVPAYVIGRAR